MATWSCGACGGENPEGMRFCGHCGAPAAAEPSAPAEHEIAEALRSFVAGPVAEKLVEAGGTLPEERRLITALFADVSGFTSLADRLDPEQLLEVIDPVISGLSSVVGRYGGYVEKFAGDALMALFGAPVSHEDDAVRALRVALEMHAELARLVQELPHEAELTLHVGVNSGHGIARILGSEARMDYAVLGDSVILAQRLESAAPPGETYVSETTVRLTEADFEFEPIGELTLKGKAEPVPAWRLVAAREERASLSRPLLIGREAELAVVDDALQWLARGSGGVLAITGEPGIGKSRLVDAATDRAVATGAQHLNARCVSYGAGLAYWPYLDLLRRATGLRTDEPPNQTRARLADALETAGVAETAPLFARLLGLPIGNDGVAALEPEAFRRALHDAFRDSLRALATAKPLVLAIEDIHWIDASSLELTAEIARLTRTAPILLLLVGRPEAHEQIWAVAQAPATIELGPFDRDAITRLAEGILGGMAPDELVAFVEQRTSGNPLFVQEMLRALREEDALVPGENGWEIRRGWDERRLPATIEGVLAARIDLLPRETATLLQTASVIGRVIRVALLEAVSDGDDLDVPLQQLLRSGFLDRAGDGAEPMVVFHHALVQDAAYSRMLRRRRRELHLRVAEAAEGMYGSGDHVIDLLARHLYLGEAGDKAVSYLLRAGERSRRLYANEEAILHYSRALELAPEDAAIKLTLADLRELVGNYEEALGFYRLLIESTQDVVAWRGAAATLRKRGEYLEALAVVNDAFATEALAGKDLRALWLEGAWTLGLCGRFDQAIDLANVGLEVGRGARDALAGQLLLQLSRAERMRGFLDQALEHGHEAEAIFEESGDLRGIATALRLLGDSHDAAGNPDKAIDALRRGLATAERVGSVEEIGGCLINLGLIELHRGNYDAAISYDRRAIEEFERVGHTSGQTLAYANLAEMLTETGEFDEALEYCERGLMLARSIGNSFIVADTIKIGAMVALRRGEFGAAAVQAEQAANLFLETGASGYAKEAFTIAAEAQASNGSRERADELEARARSLA
jgi:class 3 adenylate cyclase/tetratricopeptide (TPR) repeat protein